MSDAALMGGYTAPNGDSTPNDDNSNNNNNNNMDMLVQNNISRQSILRSNLSAGFSSLSNNHSHSKKQQQQQQQHELTTNSQFTFTHLKSVTVNFIDPTSNKSSSSSSRSISSSSPSQPSSTKKLFGRSLSTSHQSMRSSSQPSLSTQHFDLYQKLVTILSQHYDATLNGVPYNNLRSGAPSTIDHLPIRCILSSGGSSSVVGGGGSGDSHGGVGMMGMNSRGGGGGDPAEWHNGPYCHVYIAACDNIDHYRSKVRPALRAFVRQIGGHVSDDPKKDKGIDTPSSSSSSGNNPSEKREASQHGGGSGGGINLHGNSSNQYVIVYVPTGGGSSGSVSEDVAEGVGVLQDKYKAFAKSVRNNIVQKHSSDNMMDGTQTSSGGGTDTDSNVDAQEGGGEDGGGNGDDNSYDNANAAAAPPPGPISHSSKNEKELFRKFNVDFPNGRTCILSTLLTETAVDAYASTSPLKNQEWKAFLSALGNAIVAGFGQRVKKYDEELRRLDYMRAANSTPPKKGPGGGYYQSFDLSHFFLVKESLAFTYQQMQLHEEALMQYEELEAFVPESTWADDDDEEEVQWGETRKRIGGSSGGSGRNVTISEGNDKPSSSDLAAAGDTVGFRRRIRAATDVATISHLVVQYLFAREVYLLFLLQRPVEIIERAHAFVKALYKMRIMSSEVVKGGVSSMMTSPEEDEKTTQRKKAEAEAWALTTCWDVKCACDNYFNFIANGGGGGSAASSPVEGGEGGDKNSATSQQQQQQLMGQERKAACRLSELLEFARLRLLKLGDLELTSDNPIRAADADRPPDMLKPWVPWEDLPQYKDEMIAKGALPRNLSARNLVNEDEKEMAVGVPERRGSNVPPPELANFDISDGLVDEAAGGSPSDLYSKSGMAPKYLSTWLRGAFTSRESFEKKYLELSGAIIMLNQCAGRRRIAARLQGERAEVHILRGEYATAANVLLGIVDSCARDSWDRAHYWRVFRLACCQRMTASKGGEAPIGEGGEEVGGLQPLSYLNTLTRCFNPRTAAVAPAKTSELLQRDLEAVVGEESVSSTRLGIAPFLEMELMVNPTKTGRTSHPLGYLRKKVVKHFCTIGETISINLSITSHLPRAITMDGLRLFLVTFDDYEGVYRDGDGTVVEDDAFRILRIPAPMQIEPGKNSFKFEWVPMTMGQFLLSTVEIQWKKAKFHYDSALMRRPLQGVDVLQSDPTQTIELNPLFLIPGHVQQVRLVFHSGEDIVTGGSVELICSEGLEIIPPETDPNTADDEWCDRCALELEPCGPDSKIVLKTFVRSQAPQGDDLEGFVIQTNKPSQRGAEGTVQTMEAKVTTSYRHGLYEEETNKGEEPASAPMSTLLEAMVTTLDRPALTVDRADAFTYAEDAIMLSVSLHCNTPVPFFIKEWNVELPQPLSLSKDGDLNHGLFGHAVAEGEELFFGFKCDRLDMPVPVELSEYSEDEEEKTILHVVLQDEFGKTFRQVLPLDLESFFDQLRREDEHASTNSATAELRCSHDEGFVGEPVTFTYDLDLNILAAKRRSSIKALNASSNSLLSEASISSHIFRYSIFSEETDWILGGKVQGILDRTSGNSFSLTFVGIPTRSGLLKRFPEVSIHHHIEYVGNGRDEISGSPTAGPSITVHFRHPDSYKSLPYTNHMALACPSMVEIG